MINDFELGSVSFPKDHVTKRGADLDQALGVLAGWGSQWQGLKSSPWRAIGTPEVKTHGRFSRAHAAQLTSSRGRVTPGQTIALQRESARRVG